MGARSAPRLFNIGRSHPDEFQQHQVVCMDVGLFEDPHGGRRFHADILLSAERCLICSLRWCPRHDYPARRRTIRLRCFGALVLFNKPHPGNAVSTSRQSRILPGRHLAAMAAPSEPKPFPDSAWPPLSAALRAMCVRRKPRTGNESRKLS